jgi:hypothetical protein
LLLKVFFLFDLFENFTLENSIIMGRRDTLKGFIKKEKSFPFSNEPFLCCRTHQHGDSNVVKCFKIEFNNDIKKKRKFTFYDFSDFPTLKIVNKKTQSKINIHIILIS